MRQRTAIRTIGVSITVLLATMFLLSTLGCFSAYHRADFDKYEGASATWQGNGRDTSASQPTSQPASTVVRQEVPGIGQVFIIQVRGRAYEAVKKSDGRIYIIQEVQ